MWCLWFDEWGIERWLMGSDLGAFGLISYVNRNKMEKFDWGYKIYRCRHLFKIWRYWGGDFLVILWESQGFLWKWKK